MRHLEQRVLGLLAAALLFVLARPGAAQEPALRHSAPITVVQTAPFVQLALPASTYAHSQGDALEDLRMVDSRGDRVPFALLAPRPSESQDLTQQRPAALYALPRKPAAGQPWASPVEVVVQGERISVRRLGGGSGSVGDRHAVPSSVRPMIQPRRVNRRICQRSSMLRARTTLGEIQPNCGDVDNPVGSRATSRWLSPRTTESVLFRPWYSRS